MSYEVDDDGNVVETPPVNKLSLRDFLKSKATIIIQKNEEMERLSHEFNTRKDIIDEALTSVLEEVKPILANIDKKKLKELYGQDPNAYDYIRQAFPELPKYKRKAANKGGNQ